jgi:SAM-dependent methyltransferase
LAEFTGERVIPGRVDPDLFNEHLARYAFAARLARAKKVLDAGCGAGYGAAELAKTALSVVAVDNSAEALAYAREHYRLPNLKFERASCAALPHPDSSFDLVVSFEVIEHLQAWREFLLEMRRVLAPSGQFIVSTPNKLYYAESRARAGPNPYHEHEFEFAEFRDELSAIFPNIALFVENHAEGVVFQPVEPSETAEVRVAGAEASPAESHFFIAVCAHRPQTGNPTFVFLPGTGNVLRERERHILLLQGELRTKNEWLEKLKEEHQRLLDMFRRQKDELEARNLWAEGLNRELQARGNRIVELQEELEREHEAVRTAASRYEGKISELERENIEKTEWALETERRLGAELEEKARELAECVEHLHAAEHSVEERTAWALRVQADLEQAQQQLALFQASRWVKLGRMVGLGPSATAN